MALPPLDADGDLPIGLHPANRVELLAQFGDRGQQRARVSQRLERILELVGASEVGIRAIIFGSYVTGKEAPGDVDLLLIVPGDFEVERAPMPTRVLFDHGRAEKELGAHIFWLRNSLGRDLIDRFIRLYATKRSGKQQGVVEVD
jgi:predicted nucleotidyltransferase